MALILLTLIRLQYVIVLLVRGFPIYNACKAAVSDISVISMAM